MFPGDVMTADARTAEITRPNIKAQRDHGIELTLLPMRDVTLELPDVLREELIGLLLRDPHALADALRSSKTNRPRLSARRGVGVRRQAQTLELLDQRKSLVAGFHVSGTPLGR